MLKFIYICGLRQLNKYGKSNRVHTQKKKSKTKENEIVLKFILNVICIVYTEYNIKT
jgi:hypothetical protein